MRLFLVLFSGIVIGLWFSWPGIIFPTNWNCFRDVIKRSAEDKISLKATLAVSPNYLFKRKNDITTKVRIVSDACFR